MILRLNFIEGAEMIHYALSQKSEEALYQRWLIGQYEKSMSFKEFKNACVQSGPSKHHDEDPVDTLNRVKEILNMRIE